MVKKIGVGVVGLGRAAQDIHLPRLLRTPEITLVGVTDVSEKRTKETAHRYNVKDYPDYVDLCEYKDIDAVFILTPPSAHYEVAEIACENRKHIFCEKPIAFNTEQGETMVKKASNAGIVLMVGYVMRFSPNMGLLKNMLPWLGSDLEAETACLLPLPPDKATFQYQRGLGGGALFEMGTHHVDLLRWFFGKGRPVDVDMKMREEVDVATSFSLRFDNGVTTRSEISWVSPVSQNSIHVQGKKGYVTTAFSVRTTERLVRFNLRNIFREAGEISISIRDSRDVYAREIGHFVNCVLKHQQPLISGGEALEDLKLVSEIYSLWKLK